MLAGLTGWHTLILLALWVVPFILWVVALVQIARSRAAAGPVVGWVAVATVLPLVGPILWFAIGRRSLRESLPSTPH